MTTPTSRPYEVKLDCLRRRVAVAYSAEGAAAARADKAADPSLPYTVVECRSGSGRLLSSMIWSAAKGRWA